MSSLVSAKEKLFALNYDFDLLPKDWLASEWLDLMGSCELTLPEVVALKRELYLKGGFIVTSVAPI
jgi:hypothetical protein